MLLKHTEQHHFFLQFQSKLATFRSVFCHNFEPIFVSWTVTIEIKYIYEEHWPW